MKPEIQFDDWEKLDVRIGKIIEIEHIEGADKLYKLTVNFGKEIGKRIICAGIKEYMSKDDLKGKKSIFIVNLAPRKLRRIKSQGMMVAAGSHKTDKFVLLIPDSDVDAGTRVS